MEERKRWSALFLAIVLLLVSLSPLQVEAQTDGIRAVEEISFSDFSNWKSGCYSWIDGSYMTYASRICLNQYATYRGDQYRAHITEGNYKILVRELNQNKQFIRTCTLANGQEYIPSAKAVYLGISVYKSNGESGINYETFRTKFSQGFVAELCTVKEVDAGDTGNEEETAGLDTSSASDSTTSSSSGTIDYKAIETINLSDFDNWRSGVYYFANGQYTADSKRICLKNYVTFANEEYAITVSEKEYKVLVRELDKNKSFLRSVTLSDGQSYKPGSNAKYLAVSLYKSDSEYGMSYEVFRSKFEAGFKVAIKAVVENEEQEEEIEVDSDNEDNTFSDNISTSKPETAYDFIKQMLLTGDASERDISAFKVTTSNFCYSILPQLRKECYLELKMGYRLYTSVKVEGGYVKSCKFENMDADYVPRLKRARASVDTFMERVDSRMSDLEKVLLAHEYIVTNTVYSQTGKISYTAGGPLGNGSGVCQGYSEALSVLLHEMGIESDLVRSSSMNHGWTYVKLDGAWYHIDATWDDTTKGSDARYMHRFLIRNDEEFETIAASRPHSDWKCDNISVASTSTKYTNWFVHDVAGEMYYYNGMWYYWDIKTNSILRSNIQGTVKETVVDGSTSAKIILSGISNGVLKYSVGGQVCTKSL